MEGKVVNAKWKLIREALLFGTHLIFPEQNTLKDQPTLVLKVEMKRNSGKIVEMFHWQNEAFSLYPSGRAS